jgi:membrane associated rhomboid family serine protease
MPRRGDDDFGPSGYQVAVPRLTPIVKWMFVVLVTALVAQALQYWLVKPEHDVTRYVTLVPKSLFGGQIWRLVTYPLVMMAGPADWNVLSHLMWGGIALWMFGGALETSLGASRFLIFMAACVVLPAIVASLTSLLHPVFFAQPVNGIGDLSLALTAAWGTRFPSQRLVFPPISGRTLVLIVLGIQVLMVLIRAPQQSMALAFASIGTGYGLMRYWDRIDDWLDRMRQKRVRARKAKGLAVIQGGRGGGPKKIDKRFLN